MQPPNHHQPSGATGKGICLNRGDNSQDYPLVSYDGDYNDSVIFYNENDDDDDDGDDDDDDDDDVQSGSIGDCPGLQPIRQECSPALLNCLR